MKKFKEIYLVLQDVSSFKIWLIVITIALSVSSCNSLAMQREPGDPWWFEIEAIIFERDVDPQTLSETFDLNVNPIDTHGVESFTLATLQPDISLLQQNSRICGKAETPIPFPKQTVAPFRFKQPAQNGHYPSSREDVLGLDGLIPEQSIVNQTIIDQVNFNNPTFVITTRPVLQLQQLLDNPFTRLDEDYNQIIAKRLAPGNLPKYPLFEIRQSPINNSITMPETLFCQWPVEREMFASEEGEKLRQARFLPSIDVVPDGIERPFSDVAYTLPAELLKLNELKRRIQRQRDLNVLLHTAWRQDVKIGRDKAPWYRLNAGLNFSKDYSYTGLPKNALPDAAPDPALEDTDIVTKVMDIIAEPDNLVSNDPAPKPYQLLVNSPLNEQFEEVWTLDGRLRVFIEYIGGTPYLHLDSELNYRVPVHVNWQSIGLTQSESDNAALTGLDDTAVRPSPNLLQPFYFDQLRRVISNEIHYFDHPLFGMVFQIRRYQRPAPPEPETLSVTEEMLTAN